MLSEKNFINPIEFFDAFEQITKALADTLEKYQNKNIHDKDTECDCNKEDYCDCECCSEQCVKTACDEPTTNISSYKNTITDYTVTDYTEALNIMKPELNALVFDMRTFKYTDATLTFEFCDCTYKFYWDKELDRFAGIEYLGETTNTVYWDEIAGQVKDFDKETLKKETIISRDPVADNKPTVESIEDASETNKAITGKIIFDKVNKNCLCKDNILNEALEHTEFILQSDSYECGEKDLFGNIYSIRFSLLALFDSTPKLEYFKKYININDFATAIRDKFEFREVFIDINKNSVICYLV